MQEIGRKSLFARFLPLGTSCHFLRKSEKVNDIVQSEEDFDKFTIHFHPVDRNQASSFDEVYRYQNLFHQPSMRFYVGSASRCAVLRVGG
ncbi:hypothetical protein CDAR_262881 [Caerostris darwini]|uniref:Uncharacterized protein n=1 Tax=Caerostris darwini TaxID=1538125 RepID=A0AAV4RZJ4_9ARAC|nr:hypothetical protein CDAR_262881 [Caerostris darwini]